MSDVRDHAYCGSDEFFLRYLLDLRGESHTFYNEGLSLLTGGEGYCVHLFSNIPLGKSLALKLSKAPFLPVDVDSGRHLSSSLDNNLYPIGPEGGSDQSRSSSLSPATINVHSDRNRFQASLVVPPFTISQENKQHPESR